MEAEWPPKGANRPESLNRPCETCCQMEERKGGHPREARSLGFAPRRRQHQLERHQQQRSERQPQHLVERPSRRLLANGRQALAGITISTPTPEAKRTTGRPTAWPAPRPSRTRRKRYLLGSTYTRFSTSHAPRAGTQSLRASCRRAPTRIWSTRKSSSRRRGGDASSPDGAFVSPVRQHN